MKWLIVNADDFGRTHNNNVGVMRTFQHGIVTSTTMVANGEGFDEAVRYAGQHPDLGVGVHLVLDEIRPVLPRDRIPDLTDESGSFRPRANMLLKIWTAPPRVLQQVRDEWEAQIAKLVDSGISLTHLDGHGHVHVHPRLQRVVRLLQERFGLAGYRTPGESLLHVGSLKRYVEKLLVTACARYARWRRGRRFFTPDAFYGFSEGGRLSKERIESILGSLREGINELMTHPGGDNKDEPFGVAYDWEGEMNALLAIDVAAAQQRYGFELIGFRGAMELVR